MGKHPLTIQHVEAFCTLAQCKSFKQAAKRLSISQPSMVNRIAFIEESYQAQLFIRRREDNRLTDLGLMLLPKFQNCLKSIKDAEFILLAHSQVETGQIHIATVSPRRISALIQKFHLLYPNIKVKVSLASTENVQQMLLDGDIDAGFYVPEDSPSGLQAFPFHQYELVAILPKSHALAVKEKLQISDFHNQDFIIREEGSLTRRLFETSLQRHHVSVNTHYELGSREAIREAVGLGLGISVVAEDEHVPHENIVVKRISDPELSRQSCLVIRNDKVGSTKSSVLINLAGQLK